jgi:hypothetical protein
MIKPVHLVPYEAMCSRCGLTKTTEALTADAAILELEEQEWLIGLPDGLGYSDICPICQCLEFGHPIPIGTIDHRLNQATQWLKDNDTLPPEPPESEDPL